MTKNKCPRGYPMILNSKTWFNKIYPYEFFLSAPGINNEDPDISIHSLVIFLNYLFQNSKNIRSFYWKIIKNFDKRRITKKSIVL